MADQGFDFDVALSFAGEDREFAKEVRDSLQSAGITVFYDDDHIAEMWGQDLGDFFDDVYRRRARFAVIIVSRHYVDKAWSNHERKSALARAIESRMPYVLPVRLDDSDVPGLRPTTGFIDGRQVGIHGIVEAVRDKLGMEPEPPQPPSRTPRTLTELSALLTSRPAGWEYLLYAGSLYVQMNDLESKYRDHEVGYAMPTVLSVDREGAIASLQGLLAEVSRIIAQTESVMAPEVQGRAFGPPGEPGNAELIQHSAQRLISIYEDILGWAARVRGTAVPDEFRTAFQLAAKFADNPIREFRDFVSRMVDAMDKLPAHLAAPEPKDPLVITLELVLTLDQATAKAFRKEMKRLRRFL